MTISRQRTNRPFGFGENDRHIFLTDQGEKRFEIVNDDAGNPRYIGAALIDSALTDEKWQIRQCQYDSADGVIRVLWPQNDEGNASGNYEFVWDDSVAVNLSGITQANPGVVTTASAHGFSDGDVVIFEDVGGMTEVNFTDTTATVYVVANSTATTFELTDLDGANVDTSGFTAYSGGGNVRAPDWGNYTYS